MLSKVKEFKEYFSIIPFDLEEPSFEIEMGPTFVDLTTEHFKTFPIGSRGLQRSWWPKTEGMARGNAYEEGRDAEKKWTTVVVAMLECRLVDLEKADIVYMVTNSWRLHCIVKYLFKLYSIWCDIKQTYMISPWKLLKIFCIHILKKYRKNNSFSQN